MKVLRGLVVPLLVGALALAAVLMILPLAVEAGEQVDDTIQPAPVEPAGPAQKARAIGAQAVIDNGPDIQLSTLGARLPQVALSTNNSFLAVAYQQGTGSGSTIRLRSTDGNLTGWLGVSRVIGTGEAPALVFSGPNRVQLIWVNSTKHFIQHSACTVAPKTVTCTAPKNINVDQGLIESPSIAYHSSGGHLYVAWVNTTLNQIRTAHAVVNSGTGNPGAWDFKAIASSNLVGSKTSLAAANNKVHLAFVSHGGTRVQYYNSTAASHTWAANKSFGPPNANYNRVDNPALEAAGNHVYLAWDTATSSSGDNKFALMGIQSTNIGATWATSLYITSTEEYFETFIDDQRFSRDTGPGATPQEEAGLRPSLAVTGTNDFVVVWQERPASFCELDEDNNVINNGTSEVYFAEAVKPAGAAATWWKTKVGTLANKVNFYSADPDVVVNLSNKARHIVFIRATIPNANLNNCQAGGGVSEYAIFYRGPFTLVQPPPEIYLPVVIK